MENALSTAHGEFTREDKRRAIKAFSRCNLSLVVYMIVAVLVISLVSTISLAVLGEENYVKLADGPYFIWILQVLGMYVIAFPVLLLMLRKLPKADRQRSSMSFKEFAAIFFVSEAIMLIGSIISQWIVSLFETKLGIEVPNQTSDLITNSELWIVILVAVVIGPIVEELIFRKAIIDRLSVYGDRVAVVVSSLAFGLFHGNFFQLIYATALGLVLGYVYTKTRRSIYNCLLHIAVNFMGSVPALLIQGSLDRLNALPEDAVIDGAIATDIILVNTVSLMQYGLALIGIVIFIIATLNRSYSFSNECDIKIPAINRFRVYFFNFGTLLFIAYFALQCYTSLFAG